MKSFLSFSFMSLLGLIDKITHGYIEAPGISKMKKITSRMKAN